MEKNEKSCPCSSGNSYEECCKPYHQNKIPENALILMRSRYSAYALNLPDYIIRTTHPASPQYSENQFSWRRNITQFSKNFTFNTLEVLDFKEKSTVATVTFTAHLSQEERDATFTERSYFEKNKGRWFYRGGQLEEGHAPNLITTGQLRLLPLAYYGDPILKKRAIEISEITEDIKTLIEEMIETMDASNGIGIAAPQIHHSIRIFVIRTPIPPTATERNNLEWGPVKVFINPVLTLLSEESWKATEGCLSIPNIRAEVKRPKEGTIEYTSMEGKLIKEKISGWQARIIMHEYDHLEGILFIDRLDKEEQDKLKPTLENIEKRIHDGKAL